MENATKMLSNHTRWLMITCLSGSLLAGCSSDDPVPAGAGGTPPGGGSASGGNPSSGGTSSGGSSSQAGTSNPPTGGSAGASAQAGSSSGGSGGSATSGGSGGSATAGSGGSATGGSSAGGSGGAAGMPTAIANITGLNGSVVTGTATFTQGATMTKLVLNLTACPNGEHASHLHENKDCGNNGMAAGGHWLPNGEGITQYTCADNKGSLEFSKPTSMWTVGDGSATDVTKYSFMVHEGATGPRIGCGLVNKQ